MFQQSKESPDPRFRIVEDYERDRNPEILFGVYMPDEDGEFRTMPNDEDYIDFITYRKAQEFVLQMAAILGFEKC